jgi:hypothetical protein
MKQMKRTGLLFITIISMLFLAAGLAFAQTGDDDEDQRGTVRGTVHKDVNGDGRCINTGVAGEDPVAGIPIEFVSSDEETVVTLQTGDNGTYGLAAAGQSVWRVTAKPNAAEWVVTSENPLYAPVLPGQLVQTGIDFCVGNAANAVIILPESGAPASGPPIWVVVTAVLGFGLFVAGFGLEWRRRNV